MKPLRVTITTPLWFGCRTGTARPAFGRGRYHVTLDGETETRTEDVGGTAIRRLRELLFTATEMVRDDGGRLS